MNDPVSRTASAGFDVARLSNDDVVAMLASGQHPAALQAIFGPAEYEELHRLAKRAMRIKPGKNRVYLLPGIMGSTLGTTGKSGKHLLWLNPRPIAAGELLGLALPDSRRLRPLGVMLPGYLKLKLHLQLAGFDAVFHPFDWRKSVLETGRALTKRIADDCRARRLKHVMLVGHSMGGVVARAALSQDTKGRIERIVQMGAPNFGSYAMVQALRAAYPTVRKIASLDYLHTPDQLARHIFRTLPGLYEMLPAQAHPDDLDLQRLESWPNDLLGPDATLLQAAAQCRLMLGKSKLGRSKSGRSKSARSKSGAGQARCHHIVGVGQDTVTQLRRSDAGFDYGVSTDGDGTVPRALAEWSGASAWYVHERHGNLTNNDVVCKAVIDLLKRDTTRRIARTFPMEGRVIERWVSDSQLRENVVGSRDGKVNWQSLSMEERRRILEPTISAEFQAHAGESAPNVAT